MQTLVNGVIAAGAIRHATHYEHFLLHRRTLPLTMLVPILNICVYTLLGYIAFALMVVLFLFSVMLFLTTKDTTPEIIRYESEKSFLNPKTKKKVDFPFNQVNGTLSLSVVVPAYNEEERLPIMLDETFEFLEKRQVKDPSFVYEIIVVDDGSKDKTTNVALKYVEKYGIDKIRVLTFAKNRGKGGAVRMGIFCSRGNKILFVDADGATKFSDLDSVEEGLDSLHGGKENMAVSVGSRAHLQVDAVAECGFKLFTRKAALSLFSSLHVERWAFDVELLYIAQCLGIPIAEKAVNWQEIDGSKMVPIFSWLQMGRDLVLIRWRYTIGAWKISNGQPNLVDV